MYLMWNEIIFWANDNFTPDFFENRIEANTIWCWFFWALFHSNAASNTSKAPLYHRSGLPCVEWIEKTAIIWQLWEITAFFAQCWGWSEPGSPTCCSHDVNNLWKVPSGHLQPGRLNNTTLAGMCRLMLHHITSFRLFNIEIFLFFWIRYLNFDSTRKPKNKACALGRTKTWEIWHRLWWIEGC